MKKSIIAITLSAVAIAACKKDKTNEFTATDVTGTAVVKGVVTKNIIIPNGVNGWTTSRVPAAGVGVSIKVNKNALYVNSTAQGADVYSATTDNNGNYSISVRTNANGVLANITFDGFTGTVDTLINGVTKTGFSSIFATNATSRNLVMGQNQQVDNNFVGSPIVGNNPTTSYKIGSATITGSVGVNMIKEVTTGTLVTLTTTNMPVAGRMVYLNFSNDPYTMATKSYTATTNAEGYYSFDIATVATGGGFFNSQSANIWVADYATTRDTLKANNTIKAGRPGVFSMQTINQFGIYNNHIRNANHFVYSAFTPN